MLTLLTVPIFASLVRRCWSGAFRVRRTGSVPLVCHMFLKVTDIVPSSLEFFRRLTATVMPDTMKREN